ncbi:hypothetical protein DH2020_008269 [Rehmannia glutinosa]|uniref:adenine phosphoribosyltransferase n=1 Tax=Rehmannia glutinosa TaxID=99300 RepID=A0ABR0U0K3_REHGL
MSTVSKPVPHKFLEARIVSQRYLHSGNSVKSHFLLPYTNATTGRSSSRREILLIYGGPIGGAAVPERKPLSVVHMTSSNVDNKDDRISRISSSIRVIPDFPKPGIMFQDITTLLLDPKAFKDTIDLFVERYKDKNINVVAGREVISEEYSLEYGTDKIEMHVGAVQPGERAVVGANDLIPMKANKLRERVGVEVVECACVIELPELKLSFKIYSSFRWCVADGFPLIPGPGQVREKQLFVLVSST